MFAGIVKFCVYVCVSCTRFELCAADSSTVSLRIARAPLIRTSDMFSILFFVSACAAFAGCTFTDPYHAFCCAESTG
jgi:hypothetical protein